MVGMQRRRVIVHGTPITPRHLLDELKGESFCVSFAAPRDLDTVIDLQDPTGILILDNGAFSIWRSGQGRIDSAAFWRWANAAQARSSVAVAVIPDVIEGSLDANRTELARMGRLSRYPERTMAIWHMDDPLEFLEEIASRFGYVGIGSCSEYDIQRKRKAFMARMEEARRVIDRVAADTGKRPWVHVMRGLGRLHEMEWVDSADSTNLARNHTRTKGIPKHVAQMAERIRAKVESTASELLIPFKLGGSMLKLACHVCDQMRGEGDGPLCEDCLDVVAKVHEIKARPLPRNSWARAACDVCKAVGYTVNTVSPDGNVLPFPVAEVCSACGGTGRKR